MDWILEEVFEDLKSMHRILEDRIRDYSEQEDKYKSPIGTDDKFEAGKHEYWRGKLLEAITTKNDIENMIMNIYMMIDEEADRDKEYEEELRTLREGF